MVRREGGWTAGFPWRGAPCARSAPPPTPRALVALPHPFLLTQRHADWRKEVGLKWLIVLGSASLLAGYYKRWRWGPIKNRKISYHD